MKFRPALVLWGAILVAALPVWADRIPQPESVKVTETLFSPSFVMGIHDSHVIHLDKFERSFFWYGSKNSILPVSDPAPVLAPEPGSFAFLLLGLGAVGFLARRRESRGLNI